MATDADLVEHFAAHIAASTYDQLPAAAVDAAKKSILDTVGVILAASGTEPAVQGVVELVREAGGRPESTVLAFGDRVPAVAAAFANGAMAHCLDFDDQTPWGQHSASSIVPAVLAVAERRGTVTGKELITAVAVGQDVFARLRRNVGWRKDWNLSTVLGVYAATAAASRILNLTATQVKHALGIASMQSSGVMEVVAGTGSNLRALYAGFSAKGAVLATLMADKGVTGVDQLFEGEYGVFATYFAGSYDRDAMLTDLGKDFQGSTTLYKMWPAVGTAHSHISATIGLMVDHNIVPNEIAQLRVHVGDYHQLMCEPLDARRQPATLVDAKFSLPFLVAVAAVRRGVGIADFSADGLRSPEVLDMAQKVLPEPDDSLNWELDLPPGRVEVILHNGQRYVRTGHDIPGSSQYPLTWQDLGRKFADCASVSIAPPSAQRTGQALHVAEHLENLENCADLVALLR
ncbi:MmgE/PrpD family protein [Pedococcus sp. P5_B7]